MATNTARYSLPLGYDGSNGLGPRKGPVRAPLPHVDDIVKIPTDIDPNTSIKRLLEMAEASLGTAEMGRDLGQPERALKEFVRASIIVVHNIAKHSNFPRLQSSWPDLYAAHGRLLKRISEQNASFAKIKEDIVADNKRTGVQPTLKGSQAKEPESRSESPAPGALPTRPKEPNGSLGRAKPQVHPKPQGLHGNALKPGHGRAASLGPTPPSDLNARFAKLMGPTSSPGQDARIKTHQFVIPSSPPKPAGPRKMPSPAKLKLGLDSSISSLPKAPEAVYSPARGNGPGDTARPPIPTPRGTFTRTAPGQPQNNDYFSPQHRRSSLAESTRLSGESEALTVGDIPEGGLINAEELSEAMKRFKSGLLLIDVRDREEFDEGHIFHSKIICIEPSILVRDGLSALQISESLILSPSEEELKDFENRNKFDLVVFYDQDTAEFPDNARTSDDLALQSLFQALTVYNFEKLKRPPLLLAGGLDAWIDLMGHASLKLTTARGVGQIPKRHRVAIRRRSKYVKNLKPADVQTWQETLDKENPDIASSPHFTHTVDAFVRRYHAIPGGESMIGSGQHGPLYGSSHKADLQSDLPTPPTRPAPARPRPSQRSVPHAAEEEDHERPVPPPKPAGRTNTMELIPARNMPKIPTGLNNPGNWCYANSTLQSLLMSPGFGLELAHKEWMDKYKVPRKTGEMIDPPQLLTRIITNLFHWMSTGKFDVMKAQTLMDYSKHVTKGAAQVLGNNEQHDADEFMMFLFDNLHDETNTTRDIKRLPEKPNRPTDNRPAIEIAEEYWNNYRQLNNSLIDNYWQLLQLSTVTCQTCETRTYTFDSTHVLNVTVPSWNSPVSLRDLIRQDWKPERIDDYDCENCRAKRTAHRGFSLARMPPLLRVVLKRFGFDQQTGRPSKKYTQIYWDINDINLEEFFLPSVQDRQQAQAAAPNDAALRAPFNYECYAIIKHTGNNTNSGHYYAYVRDPRNQSPYAWLHCNDNSVRRVRMGSGVNDDITLDDLWRKDGEPYVVFFRRKDAGVGAAA